MTFGLRGRCGEEKLVCGELEPRRAFLHWLHFSGVRKQKKKRVGAYATNATLADRLRPSRRGGGKDGAPVFGDFNDFLICMK